VPFGRHKFARTWLCESEHKYRTLFECLSDAAFLTEEQSGKIIDANRQAGILLLCFRPDIPGRKESEFPVMDQSPAARSRRAGRRG
jgi:PAS domain-containing protein